MTRLPPPLLRGLAGVVVGLFGVVEGGGNEGNGPFPVAARIQPSQKAFRDAALLKGQPSFDLLPG